MRGALLGCIVVVTLATTGCLSEGEGASTDCQPVAPDRDAYVRGTLDLTAGGHHQLDARACVRRFHTEGDTWCIGSEASGYVLAIHWPQGAVPLSGPHALSGAAGHPKVAVWAPTPSGGSSAMEGTVGTLVVDQVGDDVVAGTLDGIEVAAVSPENDPIVAAVLDGSFRCIGDF